MPPPTTTILLVEAVTDGQPVLEDTVKETSHSPDSDKVNTGFSSVVAGSANETPVADVIVQLYS